MKHPIVILSNREIIKKVEWITSEMLSKWAAIIDEDGDAPPLGRGPKK